MIGALVSVVENNNTTVAYFYNGGGVSNASSNISNEDDSGVVPVFPAYIRTASTVVCIIIMGIGVIGNVMVPIVILKTKDMRNSTNIFLMNLSIADLLVLLVCTPTLLVEVHSKPEVWILGEEMCKAVPFVELTVAHASVLTILAISFERYYAICEPLRAGYVCTKARALIICVMAWLLAAVFTSPIFWIANYGYHEYIDGSMVPACLTQVNNLWSQLFFVVTTSLLFVVPLVTLLFLYALIARHLMADTTTTSATSSQSVDNFTVRARRQVVLMLGTVVLLFFVCLTPFRVLTLWIVTVSEETLYRLGFERYFNIICFCRIMIYLNSAINPILYNLMSSKFRNGFMRIFGIRRTNLHVLRRRRWERKGLTRNGTLNNTTTTTTTSVSYSSSRRRQLLSSVIQQTGSPELSWGGNTSRTSIDSRTSTIDNSPGKWTKNVVHSQVPNRSSNIKSHAENIPLNNNSSPTSTSKLGRQASSSFRRSALMRSRILNSGEGGGGGGKGQCNNDNVVSVNPDESSHNSESSL